MLDHWEEWDYCRAVSLSVHDFCSIALLLLNDLFGEPILLVPHDKIFTASIWDHTCSLDTRKHILSSSARVHSIRAKDQSRQLVWSR